MKSLGLNQPVLLTTILFLVSGCVLRMPPLPEAVTAIESVPGWDVSEYQMLSSQIFQIDQYSVMQTYIAQVIEHNLDLKSIAASVKATEFERHVSNAERWPVADLGLSRRREKDALTEEINNTTSVDLDINWVVDIWGKLSDETEAAHYLLLKSQYDLVQARRTLVVQAAQFWIDYWGYRRSEAQLIQLKQINSDLLEHYLEGYTSGLVPYEVIFDARKRLKNVQTHLWRVQLEAQKLLHTMNILRGRSPADELEVGHGKVKRAFVEFAGAVSTTILSNRSDIRAAFTEVRSLEFSAQAAYKALLPQITLTGSALKNGRTLDNALSGNIIWQLIGGVTQPLFNSGQLSAMAKSKSAQVESSWWQYQNVVLNAMREVEDAMASDRQLAWQLVQKQTALKDLSYKADSAEGRFCDGDLQLDELFLILSEKREAEMEVIDVEVAYVRNRLALIAALGLPIEALWGVSGDKT
jgi:outer membrane protein TolC